MIVLVIILIIVLILALIIPCADNVGHGFVDNADSFSVRVDDTFGDNVGIW